MKKEPLHCCYLRYLYAYFHAATIALRQYAQNLFVLSEPRTTKLLLSPQVGVDESATSLDMTDIIETNG